MDGEKFHFEDLGVHEILELVEKGEIAVEEALKKERQGKQRKTLLDALEKITRKLSGAGDKKENVGPGDGGSGISTVTAEGAEPQDGKQESNGDVGSENAGAQKAVLLKNIKYKHKHYKIGQEIDIDENDRDAFIKDGIIEG